jgi:PleD family two-component response regulator
MILVVDDSVDECGRFRRQLHGAGYDIHCTRTARDALQVLETMKPGLLVVDLFMPDVDGFELVRQVRSRADLRDVPILAYTISNSPDDQWKALDLGASDFLTKGSVTPEELRDRVRRLYPKA